MSEKNSNLEAQELTSSLRLSDAAEGLSGRVDCSPENIEQGLAKLVLSLIELLRQLLERQAIRRMQGGSLTEDQVEQMGEALMKLETKINELARHFNLTPADLNLDLGPLGRLVE
ncbi:MAG: gas vesicle protein K [Acidobacteria bacterium]|nr:MAG: gas vesicle protein K [Acidobacteriota bacterium]